MNRPLAILLGVNAAALILLCILLLRDPAGPALALHTGSATAGDRMPAIPGPDISANRDFASNAASESSRVGNQANAATRPVSRLAAGFNAPMNWPPAVSRDSAIASSQPLAAIAPGQSAAPQYATPGPAGGGIVLSRDVTAQIGASVWGNAANNGDSAPGNPAAAAPQVAPAAAAAAATAQAEADPVYTAYAQGTPLVLDDALHAKIGDEEFGELLRLSTQTPGPTAGR